MTILKNITFTIYIFFTDSNIKTVQCLLSFMYKAISYKGKKSGSTKTKDIFIDNIKNWYDSI